MTSGHPIWQVGDLAGRRSVRSGRAHVRCCSDRA